MGIRTGIWELEPKVRRHSPQAPSPSISRSLNAPSIFPVISFGDINPFVELLAGSGGYPIPCPEPRTPESGV